MRDSGGGVVLVEEWSLLLKLRPPGFVVNRDAGSLPVPPRRISSWPRLRPARSTHPGLGQHRSVWHLVGREARCGFEAAREVEERDERRHLPDGRGVPARALQPRHVLAVHQARGLGQLAGIPKQGARRVVQLVLGPRGREIVAEMGVPGEAANCRRMEAQSGRATDLAVDDRREHLPLEPAEW